jgi:hypothetical protein
MVCVGPCSVDLTKTLGVPAGKKVTLGGIPPTTVVIVVPPRRYPSKVVSASCRINRWSDE